MPSKRWPHWLMTSFILLGFPAVSFIYWPLVLASGVLPPSGDSVAIPMFDSLFLAVTASPVVLVGVWLCLRRFNPTTRLHVWRSDRPYRSAILTLVLGGPAAAIASDLVAETSFDWPWYEHLWTAYFTLCVYWLLCLRAAVVNQLGSDRGDTDRRRPAEAVL